MCCLGLWAFSWDRTSMFWTGRWIVLKSGLGAYQIFSILSKLRWVNEITLLQSLRMTLFFIQIFRILRIYSFCSLKKSSFQRAQLPSKCQSYVAYTYLSRSKFLDASVGLSIAHMIVSWQDDSWNKDTKQIPRLIWGFFFFKWLNLRWLFGTFSTGINLSS